MDHEDRAPRISDLLGQCIEEWRAFGVEVSLNELIKACAALPSPDHLIEVDDPQLARPGDMLGKINGQLQRAGYRIFSSEFREIPLIANTIFHSLAARYAQVLSSIAGITRKKLKRLFIVGGGSKNSLLNRLTAERSGLEVILGSAEASTVGNFAIQMAALQGSWNDTNGVAASAVAKFAEELTEPRFEKIGKRETA